MAIPATPCFLPAERTELSQEHLHVSVAAAVRSESCTLLGQTDLEAGEG